MLTKTAEKIFTPNRRILSMFLGDKKSKSTQKKEKVWSGPQKRRKRSLLKQLDNLVPYVWKETLLLSWNVVISTILDVLGTG